MNCVTWPSGSAPMKPSAGCPLTKAITAGIDWMPIWPGMAGCSSMFILTSFTLPLAARTTFSSTGVSCLHGPHHGAQKSISTGWRFDSSITSLTNDWVVVSFTSPSVAVAVAAPPLSSMSSILRPSRPSPGRLRQNSKPRVPALNGGYGGRMQSRPGGLRGDLRRGGRRRNRLDPRVMASGGQEPDQVVAADRGRHGVDQRMKVQGQLRHHGGVEHHRDVAFGVVESAERRHRAGLDAERRLHLLGRAERETAAGAEPTMQRFEIDIGL